MRTRGVRTERKKITDEISLLLNEGVHSRVAIDLATEPSFFEPWRFFVQLYRALLLMFQFLGRKRGLSNISSTITVCMFNDGSEVLLS